MSGLQDKVVIITGSSAGIGACTAVEFAKAGARVVLMARRRERLEGTSKQCQDAGLDKKKILIVEGDIMKDNDLEKVVTETIDAFGQIDVLVNNAGMGLTLTFEQTSTEHMDQMYNMHVRSPFLLTKLAMPYLKKTKGSVVNVSSLAGSRPLPHIFAYSVAKGAQDQMTRAASVELGQHGVRINAVNPGIIRTEIFEISGYAASHDVVEKMIAAEAAAHPAQRIGIPIEVAKVIVFLASPDCAFVSGACVPIDSGRCNSTTLAAPI